MSGEIRTFLVGRRNSTVPCDIALPEHEKSVSRKHLELTLTADGRCYLVHLHPKNTTRMLSREGNWISVSQDYVDLDTPILLGDYRTTPRQLMNLLPNAAPSPPQPYPFGGEGQVAWNPDGGTFRRY
jgi:hypothetical protein